MDPAFISSIVLISASGALSPGPLTAAAIALGISWGWRAGLLVAVGHTFFELPYVTLLALLYNSIIPLIHHRLVRYTLSIVIASFNVFFAYLLLKDAVKYRGRAGVTSDIVGARFKNPLLVGLILTGLNPFFMIWWATVGMQLIDSAILRYGLAGVFPMYVLHVWLDYAWLMLVTHTVGRSSRYLGSRGYRLLLMLLALVLVALTTNILTTTFLSYPVFPL